MTMQLLLFDTPAGQACRRVGVRRLGRPKVERVRVQCTVCGAVLERYPRFVQKNKGGKFFCKGSCFREGRIRGLRLRADQKARELDREYNGRRVRVDYFGYALVYEPHFTARSNKRTGKGWHPEHQVVAQRMIGRPLREDEEVHHINEIKTDNRPENLQVLTKPEHRKLHNDQIAEKLRRLDEYERRFGPLERPPDDPLATEAAALTRAHMDTKEN